MTEPQSIPAAGSLADGRRRHLGRLRLDLRRDAQAPARARTALSSWCPDLDGGAPRLETLLLLVSEVVTNAVIHSDAPADAPILLIAGTTGGKVHVAVIDAGEGFTPPAPKPPRASGHMAIGGYGLYVVDQAASRWGIDREGGTRVWFEV